jgi:hypothetical protein
MQRSLNPVRVILCLAPALVYLLYAFIAPRYAHDRPGMRLELTKIQH